MALQLTHSLIKPAPWALEPSRTRLPALWRDALWVCDCRRTPTEWMHGDAGTIVGSVEGVATSRGEALRFFGTGKYVIFPKRIAAINLPLTILAFVNFGSAGTHGHLYTTNQWDATRIEGVAISRFSDFVYVETGLGLGAGSGNRRSTGWPYAGTGWVMLGFEVTVPDHHAGRRLYIDGVDQGAHGAGSGTANSIGIVSNQGSTLGFGDDADFDLGIVAVFDRALTPAEHRAFARDPFGLVAPSAIAGMSLFAGAGAVPAVSVTGLPLATSPSEINRAAVKLRVPATGRAFAAGEPEAARGSVGLALRASGRALDAAFEVRRAPWGMFIGAVGAPVQAVAPEIAPGKVNAAGAEVAGAPVSAGPPEVTAAAVGVATGVGGQALLAAAAEVARAQVNASGAAVIAAPLAGGATEVAAGTVGVVAGLAGSPVQSGEPVVGRGLVDSAGATAMGAPLQAGAAGVSAGSIALRAIVAGRPLSTGATQIAAGPVGLRQLVQGLGLGTAGETPAGQAAPLIRVQGAAVQAAATHIVAASVRPGEILPKFIFEVPPRRRVFHASKGVQ